MSIQPYQGEEKLYLEARNPDGSLNFDVTQPPHTETTLDKLYHIFWESPGNHDADGTWENLYTWLKSKSWTIRKKTW